MSEPLLATKLYIPPSRPHLVVRARLFQRLDGGLAPDRRLILVSAPAGFGKTTLLVEWLRTREGREPRWQIGWLSLDGDDNDPVRFLAYLRAALSLDETPTAWTGRPALTALLNAVAVRPQPSLLVLDDYHLIQAASIHEAMAFLLDHLPPNLLLVIAGRADPPLPLARLRVRDQLTEVRQADLRFSQEEVAAFLERTMGLALSEADVARLERRTEGWVAGLQLAALSMQGRDDVRSFVRSFSGSHHYVIDYLAQEVLGRQPVEIQDFLRQTSILERLSAPICAAVCQDQSPAACQSILDQLETANLFVVSLDEERRWYRYHHLFADFLRQELAQGQPDRVPVLHRRASQWYAGHGFGAEAVDHALAAADFDRAADLVESVAEATLMRSEVATYLAWVDALPDALVRDRPRLCLYHAWALLLATRPLDEVRERLQAARDGNAGISGQMAVLRAFLAAFQGQAVGLADLPWTQLEDAPDEPFLKSLVAWYLGFAHMWRGDFGQANRVFEQAAQIGRAAGNVMIAVLALCHRAELGLMQAELQKAQSLYQQALDLAVDPRGVRLPIAGMALIGLGELARERNELDRAARLLDQGLALTRQWGEVGALDGYISLARLQQARDDTEGIEAALADAVRFARHFDVSELDDRFVASQQARLWVMGGRLDEVARWAEARDLHPESLPGEPADADADGTFYASHYLRDLEYMILARLLLARGRPRPGLAILERLRPSLEKNACWTAVIEVHILRSLTLAALGDDAGVMSSLGQALSLAEAEGFVRLFVDEGPPLADLLRQAAARGIAPEYVGRLLAALPAEPSPREVPGLVEPLSEREMEVLRLIVAGLSNQEIAGELVLALSTVKWHINNLYGKLGVGSRTQAIARARDLNLL